MSHMKFYYTYAILSMYTSHEEKSRTQFNIDILSFWHYFIWNSVRVNTISQDIIKRLLHDIFHIGPGISQRLPYQARQRSWGGDMSQRLIPGTIWKISCHNLFITYFTLTFSKHWYWYCKKDLWTEKLRK
jgi:hypothetical protein